jgi:hypothetical protein
MKHIVTNEKSAIGKRLKRFGLALKASPPSLSRANQLFFLCGANRSPDIPSVRREAVKRFIEGLSSEYRVIYAEGIFNELIKLSSKKNVLDLEQQISQIADKILIVLESPSAFCELGAFAHEDLRSKLIVINDSHFIKSNSFINTGPIAAATEAKSPVLWYPMDNSNSGLSKMDGIGATFHSLQIAITSRPAKGVSRKATDISALHPNKESLYFIHDLVLFTGPITHEELIYVLITIFMDQRFDIVKNLLGVLREARLLKSFQVDDKWVYKSEGVVPFLKYGADIGALMASFRLYHLRTNPERFGNA